MLYKMDMPVLTYVRILQDKRERAIIRKAIRGRDRVRCDRSSAHQLNTRSGPSDGDWRSEVERQASVSGVENELAGGDRARESTEALGETQMGDGGIWFCENPSAP